MEAAWQSIFEQQGEIVTSRANTPFEIDDGESLWYVKAQAVDVFIAQGKLDRPAGARHHLMRIPAGTIIEGSDPTKTPAGWMVIGVGLPDSVVYRLSRSDFERAVSNDRTPEQAGAISTEMIRTLVTAIAESVHDAIPPRSIDVHLPRSDPAQVDASTLCEPRSDLIWFRQVDGRSELLGRKELGIDESVGYILLAPGLWLQTSVASHVSSGAVAALGFPDVWAGLDQLWKLILTKKTADIVATDVQERDRLKEKDERDKRLFIQAYQQIAGLLVDHGRTPISPSELTTTDKQASLVRALQLVGEALGLKIKEPTNPESHAGELIRSLARANRLRLRQVRFSGKWWQNDHGPLVAFRADDMSPVALLTKERTGRAPRYVLTDPTTNQQTVVDEIVAKSLAPNAMSLYRSLEPKQIRARDLMHFGLRGCSRDFGSILALGIMGGLLALAIPIATNSIFTNVVPAAEYGTLAPIAFLLLGIIIASAFFLFTRNIVALRIEGKLQVSVEPAIWDRLLSLPVSFFRQYSTGDLANRALGITTIRSLLSTTSIDAILSLIFSSFSLILLFFYDTLLAVIAIVLVITMNSILLAVAIRRLRYQRKLYDIGGNIYGLLFQQLDSMATIKVSGAEIRAFTQWANQYQEQQAASIQSTMLQNVSTTVNAVYPGVLSLVLFIGIGFFLDGKFAAGTFFAFTVALGQFVAAVTGLNYTLISVMSIIPIYERTKPILKALPEIDDKKQDPGPLSGHIELSHVTFHYDIDLPATIENLNMTVGRGEFIAIVGPSGAGKSTLVRLLLGFDTPTSGNIYFDGQDLANLNVQAVRRQIGVVLQGGKTMPGDIFSNIIGSSALTMDDAWEAARAAGIAPEIEALPMGMHTYVNEGGTTFSGGQIQRLLIAKALARKPAILLFDEATSALDNQTQAEVMAGIEKISTARIVIAHRLSTIAHADRIYFLDHGTITESGTFDELMAKDGAFAHQMQRQLA